MLRYVVFSALFAAAFAVTAHYAGTTTGGLTFVAPVPQTNPATCVAGTGTTAYQMFTASFQAADVNSLYRAFAIFQKEFRSNARVFVYTGTFDPANPCTNYRYGYATTLSSGAPAVDFVDWITTAGDLTFVVSGSGALVGDDGLFAIHVDSADNSGSTAGYAKNWTVPYYSGNDCSSSSFYTASYQTYTYTATSTAQFDVSAYFYNSSITAVVALYQGTFPGVTITGVPADPCNGTLVAVKIGYYNSAYLGRMNFTQGNTYTIVVSSDYESETGSYGIFVQPTIAGDTDENPSTFLAPTAPAFGTTTDCTPGSGKHWGSTVFVSENLVYLIDTGKEYSLDTATALYHSSNAGSVSTPPSSCDNFIMVGDTGDGGAINAVTTIGDTYTAIVTGFSSGSGPYSLYVMTGTPLGISADNGSSSNPASVVVAYLAMILAAIVLAF
jgi:hypothetical protein